MKKKHIRIMALALAGVIIFSAVSMAVLTIFSAAA